MIVRMKKVTLVCLADDRSRTLEALRDLGVLHLAHIKEPESADLDKTRGELHRAQSALNLMGFNLSRKDNGTSNADSESRIVAAGGAAENRSGQPAQEIVNSVHDLISRKKELAEKLESLHSEKAAIEPFGNFDPALIEQLAKKGIIVKLYHWRSRKPVVPPEGTTLLVLKQDSIGQHIAIAGREEFTFAATEIPLPRRSLEEVLAALETAKADFEKI